MLICKLHLMFPFRLRKPEAIEMAPIERILLPDLSERGAPLVVAAMFAVRCLALLSTIPRE